MFRLKEVSSYLSIITKEISQEKDSPWSTWPREFKFILILEITYGKVQEIKVDNLYSITFLLRYLYLSGLWFDVTPI